MRRRGFSLIEALVGVVLSVMAIGVIIEASQLVKRNLKMKSFTDAYKEGFAVASLIRTVISRSGVLIEHLNIPQCLLTFRNPAYGIISIPFGPVALFVPTQTPNIFSDQMVVVSSTMPLNPSGLIRFQGPMVVDGYSNGSYYFRLFPDLPIPKNFRVRRALMFRFMDTLIPNAYPPFCQLGVLEHDQRIADGLLIPSMRDSGGINFFEFESVFPPGGNNFRWVYGGPSLLNGPDNSTMKSTMRVAQDTTTGGNEVLAPGQPPTTGGGSVPYNIPMDPFLIYSAYGLYGPSYALLSFGVIQVYSFHVDVNATSGFYMQDLVSGESYRLGPSVVSLLAQYGVIAGPGDLRWYNPTDLNSLLLGALLGAGKIDVIRFAVLVRGSYDPNRNSTRPRWIGGFFPMANFPGETGDRANWQRWNYAVVEMVVPIRSRFIRTGYPARDFS